MLPTIFRQHGAFRMVSAHFGSNLLQKALVLFVSRSMLVFRFSDGFRTARDFFGHETFDHTCFTAFLQLAAQTA